MTWAVSAVLLKLSDCAVLRFSYVDMSYVLDLKHADLYTMLLVSIPAASYLCMLGSIFATGMDEIIEHANASRLFAQGKDLLAF